MASAAGRSVSRNLASQSTLKVMIFILPVQSYNPGPLSWAADQR
jgi:hypothetical protein